jgi:hypothetical protein
MNASYIHAILPNRSSDLNQRHLPTQTHNIAGVSKGFEATASIRSCVHPGNAIGCPVSPLATVSISRRAAACPVATPFNTRANQMPLAVGQAPVVAYQQQLMSTGVKSDAKNDNASVVALLADAMIEEPQGAKVPATGIVLQPQRVGEVTSAAAASHVTTSGCDSDASLSDWSIVSSPSPDDQSPTSLQSSANSGSVATSVGRATTTDHSDVSLMSFSTLSADGGKLGRRQVSPVSFANGSGSFCACVTVAFLTSILKSVWYLK